MFFCTDWLHFHFWMLSLLAELMLFLPHLSKFTDGLEHLLSQSGLLPNVDCYGPGSWDSLLVTSQALLTETSFRDWVSVLLLGPVSFEFRGLCVCGAGLGVGLGTLGYEDIVYLHTHLGYSSYLCCFQFKTL